MSTASVHREERLFNEPVLPKSTRALLNSSNDGARGESCHAGLQLDKLSPVGNMEAQKAALEIVVKTHGDASLLSDVLARRGRMLDGIRARRLSMKTRGPLTLHLSRSGALENAGIALHPIYGFAHLPGSGIKGLTRAWAETVWAPAQTDKGAAWKKIEETFGWSPGSEAHKFRDPKAERPGWRPEELTAPKGAAAGRLVFHDAWPVSWPRLVLDVVNNHHGKYYGGNDDPGDWENPSLAYFLAVGRGETFEFAVSDRKQENDHGLLELVRGWLRDALSVEGAGAKTAAGYGRFALAESGDGAPPLHSLADAGHASAKFDLTLATPAFLAGASQQEEDCDLRAATLRGLLRWWWRTMYAAHLDRKKLRQLEAAVWGDAGSGRGSGSPVRIAVDFVRGEDACQYNKENFKEDLPKPSQKRTQGLFYASYGMDNDKKEQNKKQERRWYRPAGCVWALTLTTRRGQFGSVTLCAREVLEQARAALWLLTKYGGVGSRSRKGFGSFDDLEVEGIGSIRDCIEQAKRFRERLGLTGQNGTSKSPALDVSLKEKLVLPDQPTVWDNPWYALDRTGMVLQDFIKAREPATDRLTLGLPRSVGGRDLREVNRHPLNRHASPALWSLTTKDGRFTVRLIAFPAVRLPDKSTSSRVLREFVDYATSELRHMSSQPTSTPRGGSPDNQQDRRRRAATGRSPSPPGPISGERVPAQLLDEKTKKGGWKAKHIKSGLEGPIVDSHNVPADAQPAQTVQLTVVHSVSADRRREIAFRWTEPSQQKKPRTQDRRPGHGRPPRR